jgi:CheY-like chemotaxis protein/HPt (histidine-containing phosphotransfer) domain-containing protein
MVMTMRSNTTSPCILLVDDTPDNLMLMQLFLQDSDYRIAVAVNGREAVERFAAGPCDLIFMDLEMPVMDGYDATRAIRELERQRQSPPVPILALTAHSLDEHRLRCQNAGCTDFLVKPVRKAAIVSTLARFLGKDQPKTSNSPQTGAPDIPDMERLRPLLPLFFATSQAALETARQAHLRGDMDTIRSQGHKLKGSARTYGFADIGQAAQDLERAGEAHDAAATAAALKRTEALVDQARKDWT